MVVVAIIGILSAIAIPQFQTYQAKSRTSEAKMALAGIYSAQIAFQGETSFFATCLKSMGYRSSGQELDRYYTTGFAADNIVPAVTHQVSCPTGENIILGKKGGNTIASPTNTSMTPASAFTAGANGTVDPAAAYKNKDHWTIDQDKALKHKVIGY